MFSHAADFLQHAQHRFVGAAVERAVERGRGAGQRRERIDVRAADRAHRAGRAVLLVIGVQDEQHVEGAFELRVRLVLHLGHLEQHVQEVAGEAEVVVGIDVGPADAVAIGEGGDGRRFRDQPVDLLAPRFGIEDLLAVRIEGRHRADGADEHAHRVRVVGEPLHELLDVLVHHGVHGDGVDPVVELGLGGQLAEQDQIRRLEVGAGLGQLLDRVSAIHQDALVAVDVGDLALAGGGVHERRVVGAQPRVVAAGGNFLEVGGADGALRNRDLVGLPGAVVGNAQRVGHMVIRLILDHHRGPNR